MVASLRDVEHSEGGCRLAGGEQQRTGSAFKGCDALFDDGLGRVLDARVDVSKLGKREQVLCVLCTVEDVRRGLVDRRRPSIRGRIGLCTRVDLLGFELPVCGVFAHEGASFFLDERGPSSALQRA